MKASIYLLPWLIIKLNFFQLFAIIVFGCISSTGWFFLHDKQKEVCIMNEDSSACHFATFVVIIGFLVGEWFFEQMSSIKSRKHYVILDMAFSGLWALFYAIAFIYMANSWRKADQMFAIFQANIIGAIIFAFLSVFCWVINIWIEFDYYETKNGLHFGVIFNTF